MVSAQRIRTAVQAWQEGLITTCEAMEIAQVDSDRELYALARTAARPGRNGRRHMAPGPIRASHQARQSYR